MKHYTYPPADYARVELIDDMKPLMKLFKQKSGVNCRVLPRVLPPELDFAALACVLGDKPVTHKEIEPGILKLLYPRLPDNVKPAADYVLADLARLEHLGAYIRVVNTDKDYTRDVFNFHADNRDNYGAGQGRVSCVYNGAVTEGLQNEMARSVLFSPKTLAYAFGDPKNHLQINSKNVRNVYFPTDGEGIFTFNNGDIWHQKVADRHTRDPFIHRAPPGKLPRRPDDPSKTVPRLLLLAP